MTEKKDWYCVAPTTCNILEKCYFILQIALQPATHRLLVLHPTVIVSRHGNAGIAQARLLGEDHLWHRGHVDDVGAPLAEHQAFGP